MWSSSANWERVAPTTTSRTASRSSTTALPPCLAEDFSKSIYLGPMNSWRWIVRHNEWQADYEFTWKQCWARAPQS